MKTMIKRNPAPTFFDEFFGDKMLRNRLFPVGAENALHAPAINVKETEKDFQIEVAAPGMQKSDFKVSVENNILSISTEKKEEKTEATETYSRKEFGFYSFKRSFALPEGKVETDKIEARYEAGILRLFVPKKEQKPEAPKVKTIVIE
jgi:HSP20 family protein